MAKALPETINALLLQEALEEHQGHMTEVKANIASANSLVRHISAKMLDEIGPAEARAVDKVLQLPKVG